MKIINQSIEVMSELDGASILRHLERAGRVCYKSEYRITDTSAETFIRGLVTSGHESVIEHVDITIKFICDRGISHQIVRHRLASYSQESTRYCNYSQDRFGKEITVIKPIGIAGAGENIWRRACETAETAYFDLLDWGCTPQEARAVLPTCIKTELVMTANLREWRHFISERASGAAHPQIRELAQMVLSELHDQIPAVFDDLWEKYHEV